MIMIEKRLPAIFEFLAKHHQRSLAFQRKEWQDMLGGAGTPYERLCALLHSIVNTQSQPNLDNLAAYWKRLHSQYPGSQQPTLQSFCTFLGVGGKPSLTNLFEGLAAQDGWGNKTAALFVKNVINIHRSNAKHLYIFSDAKKFVHDISSDEQIYLPVDAVIEHIFFPDKPLTGGRFKSINKILHEFTGGNPEQMLVWDDLWFWGFITQQGDRKTREMKWNASKFWVLRSHVKDDAATMENLANCFVKLVQG